MRESVRALPFLLALIFYCPLVRAEGWAPGTRVKASPTQMDQYWKDCSVVSGPDSYGTYQLQCEGAVMSVPSRWVRAAPAAAKPDPAPPIASPQQSTVPAKPGPAPAAGFPAGATVLASPLQMGSVWKRCEVRSGPDAWGNYALECADDFRDSDGRRHLTLNKVSVPAAWIRADDPGFKPEMQLEAARRQAVLDAAPRPAAPPPPANGAARSVALGAYECWAYNTARMTLNFDVTGPNTYRASDGSSGTFRFDRATGALTFTGYLADALPAGFSAKYHEPKGRPTVSFKGRGGSEISFCEKAR